MRSHSLPAVWTAAIGLLTLTVPSSVPAQDDKLITLDARGVRLERVIERIAGSNTRYEVDPRVAHVPVTLSIRETPLPAALRAAVDAAAVHAKGLRLVRNDDVYVIGLEPGAPVPLIPRTPVSRSPGRITFTLLNVPLREALRLALPPDNAANPKPRTRAGEDVPDVPVWLQVSLDHEETILKLLVRQASAAAGILALERRDGVYVVRRHPGPVPEPPLPPVRVERPIEPERQRVIFSVREVPLPDALRVLYENVLARFRTVGKVVVEPDVPPVPITFTHSTNAPEALEQAFLAHVRSRVEGIAVERRGDALVVARRPAP